MTNNHIDTSVAIDKTPAKPTRNIEGLKKVRQAILEHPTQFDYQLIIGPAEDPYADPIPGTQLGLDCGTIGCVAGFACMVLTPEYLTEDPNKSGYFSHMIKLVQKELGLSDMESDWLFYPWRYANFSDPLDYGRRQEDPTSIYYTLTHKSDSPEARQ